MSTITAVRNDLLAAGHKESKGFKPGEGRGPPGVSSGFRLEYAPGSPPTVIVSHFSRGITRRSPEPDYVTTLERAGYIVKENRGRLFVTGPAQKEDLTQPRFL